MDAASPALLPQQKGALARRYYSWRVTSNGVVASLALKQGRVSVADADSHFAQRSQESRLRSICDRMFLDWTEVFFFF